MQLTFKKVLLVFVLVLAVLLVSYEMIDRGQEKGAPLEVHFLDVGQGDAILIEYLNDYQILIDGGPSGKKLLSELGKVMSPLDYKIELVVLTHPDQDHLAGLIDLAQSYEIGLFLGSGQEADTVIYAQLKQALDEKEIRQEMIGEGSKLDIGKYLSLEALNPDSINEGEADRNQQSVVLRMDYGKNSFLFTGDAEDSTEKDLAADMEEIDVDWLKVGHHGSKSSTSEEFLKLTSPSHAIISAGKANRYGHPHKEVLGRLEQNGVNILRTDERGTVTVKCWNAERECEIN